MKKRNILFALTAVVGLAAGGSAFAADTQNAEPQKPHGCLAYGAAGAVGGHFVGDGHAKLGAAGGCAYGWHKKHEWKKEHKAWEEQQKAEKAQAAKNQPSQAQPSAPK